MYTRSTWCGTFPAVRFSLTTISMGIPEKQIFVFDTVIFLWQFRYCRIVRCPETANSSSLDLFIHSYLYLLLLLFPTVFFLFFLFCYPPIGRRVVWHPAQAKSWFIADNSANGAFISNRWIFMTLWAIPDWCDFCIRFYLSEKKKKENSRGNR